LETSFSGAPTLRLLRVFNVVVAALTYCVRNAGRLCVIAWFPCALESVSRLALEWLIFSYPYQMPELLLSQHFNPPTWLTAIVIGPWIAMAWMFVLRDMAGGNPAHGLVTARILRPARLRFELSPVIFLAAAIFSATDLFEGASKFAEREILVALYRFFDFEISENALNIWGSLSTIIRIALVATVAAWTSVIAGHVLLHETVDIAGGWQLMRGNRLRLAVIFFLLTVALLGLDRLLDPARTWIVRSLTNPLSWTPYEAILRYTVDFPFSMLWIVAWAVTIGIVLDALEKRYPSTEPA
jgi:hypothetical protein